MKNYLQDALRKEFNLKDNYTNWKYEEDISDGRSFIHRVSVATAIDSNKCDWIYIVIGIQRSENSDFEIKGFMNFRRGEDDDPGRVLGRMAICLERTDIVFEDIFSYGV